MYQTVPRLLRKSAALSFALVLATPALAQDSPRLEPDADGNYLPDTRYEEPLNEAELLAAFSDKTHRGTYNFKRKDIETFAFEETTTSDGRTVHRHGDKIDRGTWQVRANVICFEYVDWDAAGGSHFACFNIYKRGNCYYHYGLGGFAFGGGSFTARSVHAGETPNCEPAFV